MTTNDTRVPDGTTLTPGRWYRITKLDPGDLTPSLKVGDVLLCADAKAGCISPENHIADAMGAQWFADFDGVDAYQTLVTGVELADAPGSIDQLRRRAAVEYMINNHLQDLGLKLDDPACADEMMLLRQWIDTGQGDSSGELEPLLAIVQIGEKLERDRLRAKFTACVETFRGPDAFDFYETLQRELFEQ